jgi:hypothetical protein
MNRNHYLIKMILLGGIIGGLGITASDYVVCKDLLPDEFLDLALAPRHMIFPIFAPIWAHILLSLSLSL